MNYFSSSFKLTQLNTGLILLGLTLAPNTPIYAQDQPYILDTIVVTATRNEKKLSDSPIRTEVITQQELQKTNATTLKEALENVSGVQLREIHGKSGYEISLQGLTSDQVLLLINGLPLASSTSSTVDLSQYLIGEIDRIEVVKGATSAQYGSSAMGGVINVITKDIQSGLNLNAQIDIGSYGSQNNRGKRFDVNNHHQSLSIAAANQTLSSRLSYDRLYNDGFGIDPNSFVRQGDQITREQYGIYTAWQPLDPFKIWLDLSHYNEHDAQRSLNFVPPFYLQQLKTEEIKRNRYSLGTDFNFLEDINVSLKAVHETYDTVSIATIANQVSSHRQSEQVNRHFSGQMDLPQWYYQQWQFGFDWHEESLKQFKNGVSELSNGDISRDRQEVYLTPITDKRSSQPHEFY